MRFQGEDSSWWEWWKVSWGIRWGFEGLSVDQKLLECFKRCFFIESFKMICSSCSREGASVSTMFIILQNCKNLNFFAASLHSFFSKFSTSIFPTQLQALLQSLIHSETSPSPQKLKTLAKLPATKHTHFSSNQMIVVQTLVILNYAWKSRIRINSQQRNFLIIFVHAEFSFSPHC
jgi:hypothetical protein